MTRGEVKKISIAALIEDAKSEESKDLDDELILKYCIAPKYTAEEVKHLQAHFCTMIVNTIMLHSGISIGPKKSKEKSVEE